jgi:hypothetical protein
MDLFIGLAYLSHRENLEYPAQDIALRGRVPDGKAQETLLVRGREGDTGRGSH